MCENQGLIDLEIKIQSAKNVDLLQFIDIKVAITNPVCVEVQFIVEQFWVEW